MGAFIPNTILYSVNTKNIDEKELKIDDPVNAEDIITENIVMATGLEELNTLFAVN